MINTTNEFVTKTNETTKIFKKSNKNTKIITKSNDKIYKKTITIHIYGESELCGTDHIETNYL